MKRLCMILPLSFSVTVCFGQFKVDSIGHVGMNAATNASYICNIESNQATPLRLLNNTNLNHATTKALYTESKVLSYDSYGIHSVGINNSCGLACGVMGEGKTNYPYYPVYGVGVMGRLNTNYGAAVYGTTNITDHGVVSNGLYAGYFNGPVKVTGALTVNGTINGTVLSPSSTTGSQATFLSSSDGYGNIADLLSGIDAHTFLMESPTRGTESLSLPEGISKEDKERLEEMKASSVVELTPIQRQLYAKQHYGLNAEALEEVFPDLVYENEDGTKSINYVEMVPLLVQAIGELKAEIAEMKGGTAKKAKGQATSLSAESESVTLLSLGQNKPNPFGETTSIPVSVPEDVQSAFLYVYNLNGSKVAQVDITTRGKTSVSLSAANLSEGMYLYSLVADGKIVQTRRMIVEK